MWLNIILYLPALSALQDFDRQKRSNLLFPPKKIKGRGFIFYLFRAFERNAILTKSIGTSWAGTIEYAYVKKNITN